MGDYKESLHLPDTEFPMRADLSDREPDQVEAWREDEIYTRMVERRREEDAERFVFHDGPPYANGRLHHGHILNKSLKDFIVKYQNMAGRLCEFVPGWDCHGLPVEHEVEQQAEGDIRSWSESDVLEACREYADRYIDIQRDELERVLVFSEWDDPYKTMSPEYEATIVRMLGEFFDSGLVYRGLKPVHWDWGSGTALAEAEVEYDSFRTEHVYATFPCRDVPDELAKAAGGRDVSVLIWTTTPWTLPANLAIALNPDFDYQLVDVDGEALILAEGLRSRIFEDCGVDEFDVLADFEGRDLVGDPGDPAGRAAEHPWLDRASVLLPAHYVTLDEGTGCVHTAPGHGQEDFALGQQHGLDVLCPVAEDGTFSQNFEVRVGVDETVELGGMHVLTANEYISEALAFEGRLLNEAGERVEIERYPYGWRSKKPVIFRATEQWFVGLEGGGDDSVGDTSSSVEESATATDLREQMLESIDEVEWVPAWGRERIRGMVESRPDWCISRQRTWGVPITAVYCRDCGAAIADGQLADHVADQIEEEGIEVWYESDVETLAPEGMTCPDCGGGDFEKESDILDVWFDSGVSWAAVLEDRLDIEGPADLYLEGSDQHRGWFQSSLLTRVLTRGESPYEHCVTHGFVTDEEGHKYSKSSQNFEPPQQMLDQYGADILRMWVASVDYTGDVALSDEILEQTSNAYRKVRNTFRFLLGNLSDFHPDRGVDYDRLHSIDRWVLHRAADVLSEVERAYETYAFHDVHQQLVEFATVELSNVYMDATKDRLYCRESDDPGRRAAQTAYWRILSALARAVAPILSFTAEEVWAHLPGAEERADSVFLADFPTVPDEWRDDELSDQWERLLEIRHEVERALEEQRQSDQPGTVDSDAEASVTLTASGSTYGLLLDRREEHGLFELFGVSRVVVEEGPVDSDRGVEVDVAPAEAEKCPRCWNYWVEPDRDDDVCERCRGVLGRTS